MIYVDRSLTKMSSNRPILHSEADLPPDPPFSRDDVQAVNHVYQTSAGTTWAICCRYVPPLVTNRPHLPLTAANA